MKKESLFYRREIVYNEIFDSIVYFKSERSIQKELLEEKLYTNEKYFKLQNTCPPEDVKKESVRKIIFSKVTSSGIIIGQTTKVEGIYHPRINGTLYYDDYEQAYLEIKKVYSFWVVSNSFNIQVLVPKDSEIIIIDKM